MKTIVGGPIIEELFELRAQFLYENRSEPEGFLLGPVEYLRWKAEVRDLLGRPNPYNYAQASLSRADARARIFGIEVRLKAQPGIDLLVDERTLMQLAMKLEKEGQAQDGTQNQP